MNDAHDTSKLIRLFVDGELPADDQPAFEQRLEDDPRLRERVAAERALQAQVASVLGGDRCPDEVAERVRTALASAGEDDSATEHRTGERRDVVASPFRANFFAVAASLLLVAGAVLWGIFGRPIDSLTSTIDPIAEAATFVASEHGRCAGSMLSRETKASMTEVGELQAFLRGHLGETVPIFDLRDLGYELMGGGPCGMPGHHRSGHLIYTQPGSGGGDDALVSVFVVPDTGQFDLDPEHQPEPGRWYVADGEPGLGHHVLRSTDGRLMYFLICCRDDDLNGVALRLSSTLRSPGS